MISENSLGKPIAKDEESLKNFWNWFGESKVVDDQGRPLVVYHGTHNYGFNVFKSQTFPHTAGYFAVDENLSHKFTDSPKKVYWVYLSLKNPIDFSHIAADIRMDIDELKSQLPFEVSEQELNDIISEIDGVNKNPMWSWVGTKTIVDMCKKRGYDGVLFNEVDVKTHNDNETKHIERMSRRGKQYTPSYVESGKSIIAFYPNQIKSIYNKGTFNPNSNNIMESYKMAAKYL